MKDKTKPVPTIKWLGEPEEHDYPAAESYLSLIYDAKIAADFMQQLRQASMSVYKAKDIFRASSLSLLGGSNSHIEKNQIKILNGHPPLTITAGKRPSQW